MQDQIETFGMLFFKGIVLPLFGLFMTWASMQLPKLIAARVKNESVAGVLDRLTALVFTVVTEVQQTVVSGLGDKADEAALMKARDQAIATVKAHLGDKGIKELMAVLGLKNDDAVTKLIITFIESAVHNLKAPKAPEAVAVATATTTEEPKP